MIAGKPAGVDGRRTFTRLRLGLARLLSVGVIDTGYLGTPVPAERDECVPV